MEKKIYKGIFGQGKIFPNINALMDIGVALSYLIAPYNNLDQDYIGDCDFWISKRYFPQLTLEREYAIPVIIFKRIK